MIISMDLNASPLPEDEENYEHVDDDTPVEEHIETAVETLRREREERRRRLKREHQDEIPMRVVRPNLNDSVLPAWNSRSHGRKKELPQGWLDCPPYGQCIDLIIPSKVPLDESFSDSIPPGKRYSSKQVIHQHKRAGKDIGFVVDLTNTSRYYSASEWTKQGIKYSKIACKGRDSVPDNEAINRFFHEVMQFVSRQKQTKKYVLVHCTHGHNRTGFMIINYLMRSHPMMTITEAIQIFAQSRPPGIYKQDYIDALYTLYHERKPEILVCPSTPEWKRSSDLDLNGEATQDEDDDGNAGPVLHKEEHIENEAMTNDDVLGDWIPADQRESLQQFCCHQLRLTQMV